MIILTLLFVVVLCLCCCGTYNFVNKFLKLKITKIFSSIITIFCYISLNSIFQPAASSVRSARVPSGTERGVKPKLAEPPVRMSLSPSIRIRIHSPTESLHPHTVLLPPHLLPLCLTNECYKMRNVFSFFYLASSILGN